MINSYEELFLENPNCLIARDFWMVEIWLYFTSPYELQFLFVLQFFGPKSIFFESFRWGISLWILWGFLLGLPNLKMTSATLNISFHINLGRFVNDWTCIIQILA